MQAIWARLTSPRGRVGMGTLASVISPSPAGLARGLVKDPASALKEGDLPLTWALSISV